jgi:glycosyltransferase involved in cell wall biosynthesis
MDTSFKIITPVYNADKWIKKCIDSVKSQSYTNFEHIIVDDCSTDNTLEIAIKETKGDSRFKVVKKEYKMGILHSHVTGHEILGKDADPEDVFVHIDGDDWLAHDNVLQVVKDAYVTEKCWMTYGSYVCTDGSITINAPKRKGVEYRFHVVKGGWCFSHLRTFKKFLWDKIRVSSLLDAQGKMYTSACDVVLLVPMMEMSVDKVHYIEDILYIYNRENPLSEDKDHLEDQMRCALDVCRGNIYPALVR